MWAKGCLVWVKVPPDYGRRMGVYERTLERGKRQGWRVVWVKKTTAKGVVNRRLEIAPDRVEEVTP